MLKQLEVRAEIKVSTAAVSVFRDAVIVMACWQFLACEAELKAAHNVTPGLAVILVGSRKDSQSYARVPGVAGSGMYLISSLEMGN